MDPFPLSGPRSFPPGRPRPTFDFSSSMNGLGASSAGFGIPLSGFGAPTGSFGAPTGGFGTPTGNFGAPTGSFGAPTSNFGAPTSSFGAPSGSFDAATGSFGTATGSFGAPTSNFGAATGSFYSAAAPPSAMPNLFSPPDFTKPSTVPTSSFPTRDSTAMLQVFTAVMVFVVVAVRCRYQFIADQGILLQMLLYLGPCSFSGPRFEVSSVGRYRGKPRRYRTAVGPRKQVARHPGRIRVQVRL